MAEIVELYARAGEHFGELVRSVKPAQLDDPTPDTEWAVRDLVNHLVTEALWVPDLVAGKTTAQVGDQFEGDQLGDDPAVAWDKSFADAVKAFSKPGALERIVHLSFADIPGKEYATQMFIDATIHSWDLAKAIGADTRLDPRLVEACYEILKPQAEGWRSAGIFAEEVNAPKDADMQTKLLALSGRKA